MDGDSGAEDPGADAVVAGGALGRIGGLAHAGEDVEDVRAGGALVLVCGHKVSPPMRT